jgi:hypothetical protein
MRTAYSRDSASCRFIPDVFVEKRNVIGRPKEATLVYSITLSPTSESEQN